MGSDRDGQSTLEITSGADGDATVTVTYQATPTELPALLGRLIETARPTEIQIRVETDDSFPRGLSNAEALDEWLSRLKPGSYSMRFLITGAEMPPAQWRPPKSDTASRSAVREAIKRVLGERATLTGTGRSSEWVIRKEGEGDPISADTRDLATEVIKTFRRTFSGAHDLSLSTLGDWMADSEVSITPDQLRRLLEEHQEVELSCGPNGETIIEFEAQP